jgi:hypothetical protein
MPHQGTSTPAPAPVAGQATTVSGTPAPLARPAGTAAEIYQGLRAQRRVLLDQLERLEETRGELVQNLRQGTVGDADRTGIEQRIAATDQQIARVSIEIAEADAQVAAAAAVPGATVTPPEPNPWQYGPPEELVAMGIGFSALLLFPVAIAYARRIWKRSHVTVALTPDIAGRISAMERSIDAVAVEVERVGEGQRFVTQLLAEQSRPTLAEGARDRHV